MRLSWFNRGGWLALLLVAAAHTASLASAADPQELGEVNVSRRTMDALNLAQRTISNPPDSVSTAMPWIARTILLQSYKTLSIDRLKRLLKWSGPIDPLFRPDVVPESGPAAPSYFVFDRAQNWKVHPDGTMSLDVVWIPNLSPKFNHYIETQWYRKEGDVWYLYKQDRRQIPGCNKWPLCVGDDA